MALVISWPSESVNIAFVVFLVCVRRVLPCFSLVLTAVSVVVSWSPTFLSLALCTVE